MNVNARCDEPATESNARGAQNAPARGRPRTPTRPSWRRTTRTTGKLTWGDPRGASLDRYRCPAVARRGVLEVAVPPAPDQRSGVTEETSPAQDTAERTTSHSLRLTLLVVLSVLLLASVAAVVYLAATRPVSALGIDGDQDALQSERESVMAQAEQFMLRINTYGPDLLEGDTMPKYRELVEEVITPKFAADFEKNAPLAEATVKQAGLARTAEVFSTGVSAIDSDSATALVAGSITQSYPKSPGSDERVRDRAGAVPRPGHAGQGQGHLAGRRLQPAHRHRGQRHERHRHARSQSRPRGPRRDPDLVRPARRRARRLGGRDPRRVEGRDRRPRPGRPPVPRPQRGRRGAPRPGQARRRTTRRWRRSEPSSRPPRPEAPAAEDDAGAS